MTPALAALHARIKAEAGGVTVGDVVAWLELVDKRGEGAPVFQPCESCECPVAIYFRERFDVDRVYEHADANLPVTLEIGDDDISVEGHHICEMEPELKKFVRWFDAHFEDRHHRLRVKPSDILHVLRGAQP